MSMTASRDVTLDAADRLVEAAQEVLERGLAAGRATTGNGKGIDDHQVLAERLAYAATELRAARELLSYVRSATVAGRAGPELTSMAVAFAAEVVQKLRAQAEAA